MPVELATLISELVPSNPQGGDLVSISDDQHRQNKAMLINQFQGQAGTGFDAPITVDPSEINQLDGVTENVQDQLDKAAVPVGGIIMYNGLLANIPPNFQVCDGTNLTPNMTDRFVYGTDIEGDIGAEGGSADAVVVSHGHSASSGNQSANHVHNQRGKGFGFGTNSYQGDGGDPAQVATASFNSTGANSADHNHAITVNDFGESGFGKNIPPYVKLAYIQRMS